MCVAALYHWRELPKVSFLSGQKHICCRNKTFVTTNTCLSRQNYVCRDKSFVATKLVSTTYFCRDKGRIFVATKMIVVAAPASDSTELIIIIRDSSVSPESDFSSVCNPFTCQEFCDATPSHKRVSQTG